MIALILCLFMVTVILCGCGKDKENIENTIEEFVTACNYEPLQIDSILRTINPDVSEKIALAINMIELFTGTDSDEIFEKVASFLIDDSTINAAEFFKSIDVEVEKIKVSGKKATVEAKVSYTLAGVPFTRDADIKCVENADKWYINGIEFTSK